MSSSAAGGTTVPLLWVSFWSSRLEDNKVFTDTNERASLPLSSTCCSPGP